MGSFEVGLAQMTTRERRLNVIFRQRRPGRVRTAAVRPARAARRPREPGRRRAAHVGPPPRRAGGRRDRHLPGRPGDARPAGPAGAVPARAPRTADRTRQTRPHQRRADPAGVHRPRRRDRKDQPCSSSRRSRPTTSVRPRTQSAADPAGRSVSIDPMLARFAGVLEAYVPGVPGPMADVPPGVLRGPTGLRRAGRCRGAPRPPRHQGCPACLTSMPPRPARPGPASHGPPADPVVITGAGMVTCLGLDRHATWAAVRQGRCGMGPLTAMEQPLPAGRDGGQAPDLPADESPAEPRRGPLPPPGDRRRPRRRGHLRRRPAGRAGAGRADARHHAARDAGRRRAPADGRLPAARPVPRRQHRPGGLARAGPRGGSPPPPARPARRPSGRSPWG